MFCFSRMVVSLETVNVLRMFSSTTTLLYLLVPAISLFYIYYRISKRRMYELLSKIDGPSGLPLVGNALEFVGDPHSKSFFSLSECRVGRYIYQFHLISKVEEAYFFKSVQKDYIFLNFHSSINAMTTENTKLFCQCTYSNATLAILFTISCMNVFYKSCYRKNCH